MKSLKIVYDPLKLCALKIAQNSNRDFAHGCNTRGMMAAGIAAVVAEQYPELKEMDKNLPESKRQLGMFIRTKLYELSLDSEFPPSCVYNFYTQLKPGSNSLCYQSITDCFEKYFLERLTETDLVELVIPEIGCGIAGGFRPRVIYAIRRAFDKITVPDGKSISVEMRVWNDRVLRNINLEAFDIDVSKIEDALCNKMEISASEAFKNALDPKFHTKTYNAELFLKDMEILFKISQPSPAVERIKSLRG